jgi:hypothetical protein
LVDDWFRKWVCYAILFIWFRSFHFS